MDRRIGSFLSSQTFIPQFSFPPCPRVRTLLATVLTADAPLTCHFVVPLSCVQLDVSAHLLCFISSSRHQLHPGVTCFILPSHLDIFCDRRCQSCPHGSTCTEHARNTPSSHPNICLSKPAASTGVRHQTHGQHSAYRHVGLCNDRPHNLSSVEPPPGSSRNDNRYHED